MGDREQAVAGVPSQRLSQLASPQLVQRTRRDNALGQAHSAFKDEMSAILRPCQPCNSSRRNTPRDKMTPQGYAGKSTAELNNAIFHHGSKKKSPEANKSDQMAFLFSCAKNSSQPPYRGGTRSLKQYVAADQLPQAFCTKFQVTDPLSGRTEIMTARRPGKASAEINLSNFDSYMLPKERTFSLKKAKDNIDHSILGLMPKKSKELKFCVRTIARQQQLPTLECKEVRVRRCRWKYRIRKAVLGRDRGAAKPSQCLARREKVALLSEKCCDFTYYAELDDSHRRCQRLQAFGPLEAPQCLSLDPVRHRQHRPYIWRSGCGVPPHHKGLH